MMAEEDMSSSRTFTVVAKSDRVAKRARRHPTLFDAWWLYNAFIIGLLFGLAIGVFLW